MRVERRGATPPARPRLAGFLLFSRDMPNPTIERFMTKTPQTIGHHQTLATAHRLMNELAVRHLPVLDSGRLIGLVSQRDLHFIETLKDVDPEQVLVSEAMSEDVFAVGPRSSVRTVAREMADHKYGCAIVVDRDRVIGIFTTVDALRALFALLEQQRTQAT
jgi:acetoin utilization protein AcuB